MRATPAGRLIGFVVILVATAVAAGPAFALPDDPARARALGNPSALEQAREASGITDPPRSRYELPAGELRLSRSELLAAGRQELEISVALDRDVAGGVLELTLPSRWVARSGVSDLPFARVPAAGRGSGARAQASRSRDVVRFAFSGAREGDSASFELADVGIPAGPYELPFRWSETGRDAVRGRAEVVFYAPARERAEGGVGQDWSYLLRETNATDNVGITESETFMTVQPGNSQRYVVGANDSATGYNAWITNNGGASFTKAPVSASVDAPGEPGNETLNLCCDPMSAADAEGNLWYGGLASNFSPVAPANPSRILVTRAAGPSATTFGPTVGLVQRTSGTQDKPMMTIDNSPSSPGFGRLYVIWDEPAGGVNLVISQCDTRPGGVLDAANCDNADNWTAPISVTPSAGSYIYADVATGPDGKVHLVWWDYSATNAIRGDVCDPASQNCAATSGWGTPQTIATLDSTGGTPIPFSCPILAQPGGRASTSPQVDVDRSGGPDRGRVYVTWSDLRTASGTTKCGGPPSSTRLTWDNFVASAVGTLPGGDGPSPAVATRLLTDGEGGGQVNSDDWFAWLAVDQTNGRAWADFYSTRDDATRRTTNFYVRSVTPNGSGHLLGALRKVSTAPSDYSASPCCTFANDYGDYTGIDATQGVALPTWSDRRGGAAADGEAFVDTVLSPFLAADAATVDDSTAAGGDGDGVLERGESFRLTTRLRNDGTAAATGVSATLAAAGGLTLTQASSAYPDIAAGATQGNATAFAGSLPAGAPCGQPVTMTMTVTTTTEPGLVPVTVPTACPAAVTPPPPPPPQPPPPPPDSSILFRLTGRATQRPLRKRVGIVVSLSCPVDDCRVAVNGTVTVPASTKRGKARKTSLKSANARVGFKTVKLTFKFSRTLRSQVSRALRGGRSANAIKVLITARAHDGAGNRATKTLTIRVRG